MLTSSPPAPAPPAELIRQFRAPYQATWDWQRARAAAVAAGAAPEAVLLVEHTPVFTFGTRSDPAHLLTPEETLRTLGAEVHWIDRGGDATWHGPGQLTGYPILDLSRRGRDLHGYVWGLEQVIIDVCEQYGVTAARAAGRTGVWVGDEKIAAIGVKIRRWVTYHGFAVNVDPDLRWFDHIVPCGLHGYGVTSLVRLLGRPVALDDVADRTARLIASQFGIAMGAPGTQSALTEREPPPSPSLAGGGDSGGERRSTLG